MSASAVWGRALDSSTETPQSPPSNLLRTLNSNNKTFTDHASGATPHGGSMWTFLESHVAAPTFLGTILGITIAATVRPQENTKAHQALSTMLSNPQATNQPHQSDRSDHRSSSRNGFRKGRDHVRRKDRLRRRNNRRCLSGSHSSQVQHASRS